MLFPLMKFLKRTFSFSTGQYLDDTSDAISSLSCYLGDDPYSKGPNTSTFNDMNTSLYSSITQTTNQKQTQILELPNEDEDDDTLNFTETKPNERDLICSNIPIPISRMPQTPTLKPVVESDHNSQKGQQINITIQVSQDNSINTNTTTQMGRGQSKGKTSKLSNLQARKHSDVSAWAEEEGKGEDKLFSLSLGNQNDKSFKRKSKLMAGANKLKNQTLKTKN